MKTTDEVSHYYSEVLKKTEDLSTNACTTSARPPKHIIDCISRIDPAVNNKYYGCGLCIPEGIEGCTVLDLGCGSGRDVFIASQLVGPTGHVFGVDMTTEQINTAIAGQKFNKVTNNLQNTMTISPNALRHHKDIEPTPSNQSASTQYERKQQM